MEKYRVTFKQSVAKDFRTIPKSDIKKLLAKIDSLAENTRRDGAIKQCERDLYRIRQGFYRIIYEIRENELVIREIQVGYRSDDYKRN